MTATLDLTAVKTRMKATWEAGDYATFATYMEPGAVDLLKAWGVERGQRLLDVGCGAGQLAIPAARMGLKVTGVDIAANLVARARERAVAEGLSARFDEGDAEALPYEDGSFDVVASIFGAMFAPRPERVAAELLRVCRPGGRVLMGNWTPASFPAQMFRTVAGYVPPPNVPSPVLWGEEAVVRERFAAATKVRTEKRLYSKWSYPFPASDVVDFFARHFGPVVRANGALGEQDREALRSDLVEVFERFDRGSNGTALLEGEFLSVEIVR
jgi:SAM-dependent methyltransferase